MERSDIHTSAVLTSRPAPARKRLRLRRRTLAILDDTNRTKIRIDGDPSDFDCDGSPVSMHCNPDHCC